MKTTGNSKVTDDDICINERMLACLCQLGEHDHIRDRGDLDFDESYPYRVLLGGYAISALMRAREVQNGSAVSYRNFNVGAAAVTFNRDANKLGIFTGFNAKVNETNLINIHAEDIVINKVRHFGGQVISLLAVVGDIQPDQQSGLVTSTLQPCGRCRQMLGRSELITKDTIFMSATTSLQDIEIYDFAGLVKAHDEQTYDGIQHIHLHSFQQNALVETPWDIDWDAKVRPLIMERTLLAEISSI